MRQCIAVFTRKKRTRGLWVKPGLPVPGNAKDEFQLNHCVCCSSDRETPKETQQLPWQNPAKGDTSTLQKALLPCFQHFRNVLSKLCSKVSAVCSCVPFSVSLVRCHNVYMCDRVRPGLFLSICIGFCWKKNKRKIKDTLDNGRNLLVTAVALIMLGRSYLK